MVEEILTSKKAGDFDIIEEKQHTIREALKVISEHPDLYKYPINAELDGDRLDGFIATLHADGKYLYIKIKFCDELTAEAEKILCSHHREQLTRDDLERMHIED